MNLSMKVTSSLRDNMQSLKIALRMAERLYSFSVKSKKQCWIVRQKSPEAISSGCVSGWTATLFIRRKIELVMLKMRHTE